MEQYYKNFNRALIEDTNSGEQEIHIFVKDRWVDSDTRTLPPDCESWRGSKLLAIYAAPNHTSNYLSFGAFGKVLWEAESKEDKAKRENKEALLADVAKAQQTLKDLQTKLDSL